MQDLDIDNDPYTTDCVAATNASNPHAYTQFIISNGEVKNINCIVKQPGKYFS